MVQGLFSTMLAAGTVYALYRFIFWIDEGKNDKKKAKSGRQP